MSDNESPAPVREGDILAKKYRVEKVLGIGGMGVVVSAMHLQLDRRVALKFLLPTVLCQQEVVARFSREARAAAQIRSEHVARVIDVGELETGSPYMVMEFLEGEDLEKVVEKRGALPVADVAAYVLQACDALAEAHALGIIHRDLKPANLFLAKRPDNTSSVKVLDFGISKVTSLEDAALTNTRAILGSPYYMSPEQLVSTKSVDARADVWALGVILYELLTGKRPFEGESMPALVAAILQNDPPPLVEVRPDLPALLRGSVMRCLEKDRAHRFASVAGLAHALAPFASAESLHLPNRISRVLGEVPSAPREVAAAEVPSPAAGETKLATPAPFDPLDTLPLLAATSAKSSWGATHSAAAVPPVRTFPARAALGVGAAVAALAAIVAIATRATPKETSARSEPTVSVSASSSASVAAVGAANASTPSTVILFDAAAPAETAVAGALGAGAPRPAARAAPVASSNVASTAKAVSGAARRVDPAPPPSAPQPPPPVEPANKMKMEWK